MDKQVLADLRPAYYDDFHCIAADCKESCCIGWRISFDKKDYLSLKRQSGSDDLNTRMEHGLRRIRGGDIFAGKYYGEFTMTDGRCPLLREDSLCALQLEKGHEVLPYVCRAFPRAESYQPSGYFERSLSPACEAVLRLLWVKPEGVDFRSDPLPKEQHQNTVWEDTGPLLPYFQDIRSQCIDVLQDRKYPLPKRILMMGLLLKELADGNQDVFRWLHRAQSMQEDSELPEAEGSHALPMFLSHNLQVILALENPDPQFAGIPKEITEGLGVEFHGGTGRATVPTAPYLAARKRFAENFAGCEYFMENLMAAVFFHLHLPDLSSSEALWKSYVSFCSLYSIYRFLSVLSCREGASGNRDELFRLLVFASRSLLHNNLRQSKFRDELFQHDSATLAHMAILLAG